MKPGTNPKSPPATDAIQRAIGSFGKYQLWLFFLLALPKFPNAFNQMSILFLAPKVSYTCDGVENACPCTKPVYNTSIFSRTIIMEWGLICEKNWLTSFTQAMFQLGVLLGSVVFGMASDRFGRKFSMICAVVLQESSGVVAAYTPDFWSFTFIRFLTGGSIGGTSVISFVILMEFVGAKYRDIVSALSRVPFNLGLILLPGFGYFFRDYFYLQLAISMPGILLFSYFCLLPETPRWLIAAKRTDEAISISERVAKVNNRPIQNIRADIEAYQAAATQRHLKKRTILDLFATPNLRKRMLIMAFVWMAFSYCFFGVMEYVGELSGNVFVDVAASGSINLLGTFVAIPLLKFMGRKTIVIVFNFICTFCLLVLSFIPPGIGRVICASLSVVAIFIVMVVIYLYCSELFPTVIRSTAIGFSSMCARFGAMLAPFVIATEDTALWLPPVLFAVLPLIAGCITFLLPETKGCELMTTIEEAEQFGKIRATSEETK